MKWKVEIHETGSVRIHSEDGERLCTMSGHLTNPVAVANIIVCAVGLLGHFQALADIVASSIAKIQGRLM